MTTLEKMKEGIQNRLDEVAARFVEHGEYNYPKWTAAILDALTKEGKAQGFSTCAPRRKAPDADYGSEWMFDACWLEYHEGGVYPLRKVALAAECEWWARNPTHLEDDFSKLVVVRADLRLLICEAKDEKQRKNTMEWLRDFASGFDAADGDEYMVSCWVPDKEGFVHECFSVPSGRFAPQN